MNVNIIKTAINKAKQSTATYKISALGFNKKGDFIVSAINKKKKCAKGMGLHAEIELIKKYRKCISTILICRVNNNGDILPIDPCDTCRKICKRLNIRIITINSL
jgi:cytidine deaminase